MENLSPKAITIILVLVVALVSVLIYFSFKEHSVMATVIGKDVNEFVTTDSETTTTSIDEDGNVSIDTVGEDSTTVHRVYTLLLDNGDTVQIDHIRSIVYNHDSNAVQQCLSKIDPEPGLFTHIKVNKQYLFKLQGVIGTADVIDATPSEAVPVE